MEVLSQKTDSGDMFGAFVAGGDMQFGPDVSESAQFAGYLINIEQILSR
ncbi:MAG: hypothetical protein Q8M77_06390 [Hydrogenophaga sp.]|nr:hypothetical protein [Hydrogenophaga sp.]